MHLRLDGEKAQTDFGRRIAGHLEPPCVVNLQGDLGTGKTTLVRGVLRGLGHAGPVRSPTFTLLEPYEMGSMQLYHLDLYRLGDPEELEYLGLRDLLDEKSVLFVEWPERGRGVLPAPDLVILLRYADSGRELEVVAKGPRARLLVSWLSSAERE
jgi:tRNA threonylcarbamoyladenosine biosynthesis protein TsaE